ncbi:MAG: response regulator [Verrucomicrobiota bacterium]
MSVKKIKPDRILIVEDDPVIQRAIRVALTTIGDAEVEVCDVGATVKDSIERFTPELILLDYKLPDVDGISLFRELKEEGWVDGIPVIFITANVMPDDIERYKEAGALGVIPKPFDTRTLSGTIQTIWNTR